ncbi:MAG TPA: tetratricopeptide repeat protein [Methanoculleus sp.]|nr:tetratricopeptide repeat protein [Methanoculleus sp.]
MAIHKLYRSPRFQLPFIAVAVLALDCLKVNLANKQLNVNLTNLKWTSIDALSALTNAITTWIPSLSLTKGLELFGVVILLFLTFTFIRYAEVASKSVTIDEFRDCRQKNRVQNSKEPAPKIAEDLNHRLVAELTRMCSLHENAAGSMDVKYRYRPEPPRITADTRVNAQKTFQSGPPVNLGPISLPQELIRDVASRLVRGARIVGILFEEDSRLHLVAHRIGSGNQLSWTVVGPKNTAVDNDTSPKAALDEMIHELACKIFASLYIEDATEWKAVRAFNQGLEEYLHSKAKPQDRTIGLIRAEEKFIETLSEDNNYHKAYHNLGVIYREQEKWQAAESAFILSMHLRPKAEHLHYTLAQNYFDEAYDHLHKGDIANKGHLSERCKEEIQRDYWNFCRTIELCDACLILEQNNPQAHELKGFAYRLKGYIAEKCPDITSDSSDDLDHAIQCRYVAVKQSWRALCRDRRRSRQDGDRSDSPGARAENKDFAAKCLNNMAYTLHLKYLKQKSGTKSDNSGKNHSIMAWRDRLSFWLLSQIQMRMYHQALALNPANANPHLGVGEVHLAAGRLDLAVGSFKRTVSIDYTLPSAWMYLALTYDRLIDNPPEIWRPEFYQWERDHAFKQLLNYIEEGKAFHLYQIAEEFENRKECKDITTLVRRALGFLKEANTSEGEIVPKHRYREGGTRPKAFGLLKPPSVAPPQPLPYITTCDGRIIRSTEGVTPGGKPFHHPCPRYGSGGRTSGYRCSVLRVSKVQKSFWANLDSRRRQRQKFRRPLRIRGSCWDKLDSRVPDGSLSKNLKAIYDDWHHGECCRVRGTYLLDHGIPDRAEKMFQESLKTLKPGYPERIRENSIYASQAHAQLQQKNYLAAIKTTHDAILLDPRCSHAHLRRGQGLCGINDLDHCINEYRLALQCDPEQPEIYFRIGQVNLLRAQRSYNPEEKRELLQEAFDNFNIALELRKSESKDIAKIYYWFGKISLIRGSYNEAKAYFETAESFKVAPIKIAFHLGEAHLGMKYFATSEDYFGQAHENLKKFIGYGGLCHDRQLQSEVEEFLEDGVCAGALLIRLHIRSAILTIYKSEGAKKAEEHLEAARKIIAKISNTTTCQELEAEYLCAQGWLLLEQQKYPEARNALKDSHIRKFTAQSYWYLARAYYESRTQACTPEHPDELAALACKYCDTVKMLDITGNYSKKAEQMLASLKAGGLASQIP